VSVRRLVWTALLLWAPVAAAEAQDAVFRAQAERVRVDVSVTANGVPVRGLTADDFDLRDNGVRQTLQSVELERVPIDVVLLLDASSSVAGERLTRLRDAAQRLVKGLRSGDRAALMTFGHRITMAQAMTSDLGAVAQAVAGIDGRGATALHDAIFTAALTAREPDRRLAVVIFSDGLDTASWLGTAAVIDTVRRTRAVVYTVAELETSGARAKLFTSARTFLQNLATESGGKVWWVPEPSRFADAFAAVLRDLTTRYVLAYEPSDTGVEGWHDLRVTLTRRTADVSARTGYYRK
jgi:Ca-activated chloride channel homolog